MKKEQTQEEIEKIITENQEANEANIDQEEIEEIIDTDEDGNELSKKDQMSKLRDRIKKLEAEKQDYLGSWQRALADYKNREKQIEEEKKSWGDFAIKRFSEDLLVVMDTYDAARSNTEAWNKVDENWRSGIEYIFNTFENKLSEKGFQKISVKIGDTFDPNIHEGLGFIETQDKEMLDKISQVIMSGYNFKNTLFRPAKVKIYK